MSSVPVASVPSATSSSGWGYRVAPKVCLRHAPHVGDVDVADISMPPTVLAAVGVGAPPFGHAGLLRIR
jgi:hypothetical protein